MTSAFHTSLEGHAGIQRDRGMGKKGNGTGSPTHVRRYVRGIAQSALGPSGGSEGRGSSLLVISVDRGWMPAVN